MVIWRPVGRQRCQLMCLILKGDSEDPLEVPIPESISGSVSVGSLSIALQEDDRNEVSELSASSTSESVLQCTSLKEDAGETTALLGK